MSKTLYWGFIDLSGEMVVEPGYDGAGDFHEGLAMVKIDWRRGFIDRDGKIIIEPQFQAAGDFVEGLARVMDDDKWGFIDQEGRYVIQPQFDKADDFHEGLARVMQGDRWIYIDRTGTKVGDAPETLHPERWADDDALTPTLAGDLYGYANREGIMVIDPKYCEAGPFREGLAKVKQTRSGKWGYITAKGTYAFKTKFKQAGDFSEGRARVLVEA